MPNDDGTFSVYLNDRVDPIHKKKAFEHELEHIEDNDFYTDKPINEVEDI